MNVRKYRLSDIPRINDLVCAILPNLPNYAGVKVDRSRIEFLLTHNINNDGAFCGFLLVGDDDVAVGGIAGFCSPLTFSWDLVTTDLFLFILPQYRSILNATRLMTAYRDWGIARGATLLTASHTGGEQDEKIMARLLRSVGFHPVGRLYHYRRD